jgi:hypothetical protein
LAETLYDLSYLPTKADPDVWIRPGMLKPYGFKYYEMILCYADDVLSISHDLEASMKGIQGTFKFEDDKIEVPTNYLRAQISQKAIDGVPVWMMTSEQYIKAAIANVETILDKEGQHLPSRCLTPMKSGYQPEIDASAKLKTKGLQ